MCNDELRNQLLFLLDNLNIMDDKSLDKLPKLLKPEVDKIIKLKNLYDINEKLNDYLYFLQCNQTMFNKTMFNKTNKFDKTNLDELNKLTKYKLTKKSDNKLIEEINKTLELYKQLNQSAKAVKVAKVAKVDKVTKAVKKTS